MTCVVVVPAPLRALTDGAGRVDLPGSTVRAVFDELGKMHPPLLERICEPDGGVRSFVNVYVNDLDIRNLQGLDTAVEEGDEILLVPAIAGG